MQSYFIAPGIFTLVGLGAVYYFGGWGPLFATIILAVLEITLSFDNAVVNAKVLARMSHVWRVRFLTWGMITAVFGTRIVLPILIVSAVAFISPWAVTMLAISDPEGYAHLLEQSRYAISAFGGAFLLMVALKYFMDEEKDLHWLAKLEASLMRWGSLEALEMTITMPVLAAFAYLVPDHGLTILMAGIFGIILFNVMEWSTAALSEADPIDTGHGVVSNVVTPVAATGLSLFVYLNVLDAAFSLDGVIGAFAVSTNLLAIAVGLAIGAFFVRSFTIMLVEQKSLAELPFLEHGAHWAIFALAAIMFIGLVVEVPEPVTGFIGLVLILSAYFSSRKHRALRV